MLELHKASFLFCVCVCVVVAVAVVSGVDFYHSLHQTVALTFSLFMVIFKRLSSVNVKLQEVA